MNRQLIITHPGGAHFDEVTAIGLILAANPEAEFAVQRRDPDQEELDDSGIWVIDTGGRLEPQRHNFDHHQSLDVPASFVLVADYLGLLDTLKVMSWWDFKDSVDRIGPARSSQLFGAGDDLVNRNPMENWLVDRFASDPQSSLTLLKTYGNKVIEDARGLKKQIEVWKNSRRLVIAGLPVIINETTETFGLEEFRRTEKDPPDIVISMDRRSQGWRLYRFDGAAVDFSLISSFPQIEFAHKSGFLAKTRERISIEELIALITQAITSKPA
jgi:hypothetical protein